MSTTKHLGQGDSFAAFIDLQQNELRNPIGHQLASPPSSPVGGQFYYNTATNKLYYYNGSAWIAQDGSSLTLAGDVTGSPGATSVGQIQGVAITSGAATLAAQLANGTTRTASATAASGEETIVTGSTASQTLTLPTTPQHSEQNTFANYSSVNWTVAAGGSDTINNEGTTGSLTVTPGEVISLIYLGTTWYVLGAGLTGRTLLALVAADYLSLSGGTMSGPLNMNSQRIENLPTPSVSTDAAPKSYVDSAINGLDPKPSVTACATSALTAVPSTGGLQTVDGVTLTAGQRVLVTDQATASQNGIWVAASGAWTRPTDFASASVQAGAYVLVEQGTANAGAGFILTGSGVTVDTTSETWVQFSKTVTTTLNKYTTTIGNGSNTAITVTHGLGNAALACTVMDSSGDIVECDVTITSTTATFTFAVAPASNAYTIVLIG